LGYLHFIFIKALSISFLIHTDHAAINLRAG